MKKTIVVTGVAGYIGGQVALQLKDAGHTVIGIDRRPLQPHQKIKHYLCNLLH